MLHFKVTVQEVNMADIFGDACLIKGNRANVQKPKMAQRHFEDIKVADGKAFGHVQLLL